MSDMNTNSICSKSRSSSSSSSSSSSNSRRRSRSDSNADESSKKRKKEGSEPTLVDKVFEFLDVVQFGQFKGAFSEIGLDDAKLRDICKSKKVLDSFLSNNIGIKDESQRDIVSSMLLTLEKSKQRTRSRSPDNYCLHLCVEKMEGNFICNQCRKYFNYDDGKSPANGHLENLGCVARDIREREIEASIIPDEIPLDLSEELREEYIGKLSHRRGVPIRWLVEFTMDNDCWDMMTQDVCRKFVFPETAARRCRYVELDHMKGIVGPAATFISHCRGGTWGDLVAAVCDGDADRSRMVWIDIFACRQWPSLRPDLDFEATIPNCTSLLVVCSYLKEVEELDWLDSISRQTNHVLPTSVLSKIAFLRVWCLMEIYTASQCKDSKGIPIILKGGERNKNRESIEFEHKKTMLKKMSNLIDIRNAKATLSKDKEMILDKINSKGSNEQHKLNGKIRGIINSSFYAASEDLQQNIQRKASIVQNAACGDGRHLAEINKKPSDYFVSICSGGFVDLLEIFFRDPDELNKLSSRKVQALRQACEGGHYLVVKFLILNGANVNNKNEEGWTPLMLAVRGGQIDVVKLLIECGADINAKRNDGWHAMIGASIWGNCDISKLLLKNGADINAEDTEGRTPLTSACAENRPDIVEHLIEGGADVNRKNRYGTTALIVSCARNNIDVVKLLLSKGAAHSINYEDDEGDTALLVACWGDSRLDIVKLLVANGADTNYRHKNGRSAVQIAKKHKSKKCERYLTTLAKKKSNSMNIE